MVRRAFAAGIAAATAVAALALAARHPVAPAVAVAAVVGWTAISARWPGLWWFAVPAALPVLDFSPWTGVLIFDEFDLLLLATLAGAWWQVARSAAAAEPSGSTPAERTLRSLLWLVGLTMAAGLARGLLDAGGVGSDAFQGYADPLNSLRVTKSVAFALLFSKPVQRDLHADAASALGRLARGMWAGMAVVAAAVFAERAAFPGLFDFSESYRTTALFWEMHVGGAAIDVYTVAGAPFVAWAVWSARSPAGRVASALLALAWGYVCLTTFSRGVWLALLLSLSGLAVVIRAAGLERDLRWRRVGDVLLLLALIAEVGVVAVTGSFLGERLGASDRDLSNRRQHWADGVRLLVSPTDWIVGIGSGRLPARYAAEAPRREFSGSARVVAGGVGEPPSFLTLTGPRTEPSLAGLYALTQRVPLPAGARFDAELSVRTRRDTRLALLVCEMHLLYFRQCQGVRLRLRAAPTGAWEHLRLPLGGPPLDPGRWFAPRAGVLLLSIDEVGGAVDIADVRLHAAPGASQVRNGRFADGLAGWFPVAQHYYLPWHIDNFVLETLIERGIAGLLAAAGFVGFALVATLRSARGARLAIAPFLGASLAGVLLVGAVSSVQDSPRVAFAFWLLVMVSAQLRATPLSTACRAPLPRRPLVSRRSRPSRRI